MKIIRNKSFRILNLSTRGMNSLKRLGLSTEEDVHLFIEHVLNNEEVQSETTFYSHFRGSKTSEEIVKYATGFPERVLYCLKKLERMGYSGAIRTPKNFDGDEFVAFINVLN